jgi:hypothetical protein
VGNTILLYTLRELFAEHIKPITNLEAIFSFEYRNPYLLQIYLLIGSLFANVSTNLEREVKGGGGGGRKEQKEGNF